jgi:hypothetical protein
MEMLELAKTRNNYIHTLQDDNKELTEEVRRMREEVQLFRAHLQTAKFQGDNELSRYINVADVESRLQEILYG